MTSERTSALNLRPCPICTKPVEREQAAMNTTNGTAHVECWRRRPNPETPS